MHSRLTFDASHLCSHCEHFLKELDLLTMLFILEVSVPNPLQASSYFTIKSAAIAWLVLLKINSTQCSLLFT